jgi:methylglutaconyl-CoA hydratase
MNVSQNTLMKSVDEHGVCTLIINRPEAMNSMNGDLVHALADTFSALADQPEIRVIVLTAQGDKVFCAGADLKERKQMSDAEVSQRIRDYKTTFERIANVPKPVICAINGYAFGGGLEIALACDFRIVAQETSLGLTELGLGIIPGAGGTQRLPRLIGVSKAKELMFTARRLSGPEALEWGVVNRCVPRADLLAEAYAFAMEMVKSAPIALAQAKRAIDQGIQVELASGIQLEAECYAGVIPTEDRLEGLAAFAERRTPIWKGH